jgi:hypothetical protein
LPEHAKVAEDEIEHLIQELRAFRYGREPETPLGDWELDALRRFLGRRSREDTREGSRE